MTAQRNGTLRFAVALTAVLLVSGCSAPPREKSEAEKICEALGPGLQCARARQLEANQKAGAEQACREGLIAC